LGPSLLIQAPVDWAALGTAVHGFLAADLLAVERDERLAPAASALERWSVQSAIHAEAVAAATGKRAEGCFVHLVAQGCAVSVTKPAV